MAPRIKIEKEMIISAAIECVRQEGAQSLTERNIAGRLGCSIQPIFRVFNNMETLKLEVIKRASDILSESMYRDSTGFSDTGLAYIRFAKEEKELFKLLYMSDFRNKLSFVNAIDNEDDKTAILQLAASVGLDYESAKQLYLEMWIYTHGIASMLATDAYQFSDAEIEALLTGAYTAFLNNKKYKGI